MIEQLKMPGMGQGAFASLKKRHGVENSVQTFEILMEDDLDRRYKVIE